MQPNPTPTPTPPAPAVTDPVVELIRNQRQNVGYALTVVAALFLVAAVMMVVQNNKLSATATTTATDKDKGKDADKDDPLKDLKADSAAADVAQPNRFDYVVGAFGAVLGLLITGAGAAYLIVGLPKPTEAEQRREARVLVLVVGGLLGAALIIMGLWFFVRWSDSAVKWLDRGEMKEAKYVLYPLLMVVLGGGLMMIAIQPARAEERNNTTIRRLVYGSNFGLTVLILFVVLVIANAVVAMRVPNKLDTTSTGFYSLNAQTQQMLEGLEQPIRAYAIFQDSSAQVTLDTRRLLSSAQDANPSKFQVRFLSPALNRDEINKLRADYPLAEMSREGVLLVAGEEGSPDRQRHSFIRDDEFGEEKRGPDGRPVVAFTGEPKLLRELMFLAENKKKPKVYFTQSSGELALSGGGRSGDPRRTATGLKSYLEKNYFDVAELTFNVGAPTKVPDDATVVVIADPSAPLPANGVEAIRKFMSEPRPDGSKGKLVVLAGQQPGPDRKPLQLGLDPVLSTFGVRLSDRFLYNVPTNQLPDPRLSLAVITKEAVEARNPVALAFASNLDRLPLFDCREVTPAPGGTFRALTVLSTMPGRTTWSEAEYAPSPVKAWQNVIERVKAIESAKGPDQEQLAAAFERDFQITRGPRPLAVFVSETEKDKQVARVAVFGCGWFVSDDAGAQATDRFGARGATLWLDLMGSTLDWIRDRPTVGVTEKPYTSYQLKPGFDNMRLTLVPLALSFLIVVGLGAGVWVIRRK